MSTFADTNLSCWSRLTFYLQCALSVLLISHCGQDLINLSCFPLVVAISIQPTVVCSIASALRQDLWYLLSQLSTSCKHGTVGWQCNIPATGQCASGMDLLRQLYVLPHWDRHWRQNLLSHIVTYIDSGPANPNADQIRPSTLQGSHQSNKY